ncbi:tetratricopeptide repeat protein [uncultured Aquimarina sp.]|uniref:tetratricopeptide repeat protein n=1 Tax=uncultured Aquimarina sp. TaxID=575652 RepID=UPI0026032680|nr:tetratricopeptide repeat protein [uncultured Aquimarina sp.]
MRQELSWLLICILLIISFCKVVAQVDNSLEKDKKQIDDALQILRVELRTAQKNGSPISIAEKYFLLGGFYQNARVYDEALEQYNKAVVLIEEKDTLFVLLKNEIGKIYLSTKNFPKAKQYFNQSQLISSKFGYKKGVAIAKRLLGSCFEKEGDYLKALQYQKESLKIFSVLRDIEGVAVVNENLGSIYEDLEQYDVAYEYFKKSNEYFEKMDKAGKISVFNNLGDICRKTGNYSKAIEYTNKAHQSALYFQDKYQIKSAHKDLSKTYNLMGDFKKAFDHLSKSEKINEELILSENINQLNTLQAIYETKQKEAQIGALLQQKEISRANQNLLLVSLGAIILIAGVLYVYYRRKGKESLRIQEFEQRTLKAELEKKEFEEKNLQREIHLKTSTLSRYSLHLSQKNKILSDLSSTLSNISNRKGIDINTNIKRIVKEINFNLKQEREWDEFHNFFKEIHPDFTKRLSQLSEDKLSPAELRLGMLLRLNLSSKEIASILRVTPDSVRVARYRLRKKLPINQKEELVNFMIAL